MTTQKAAAEKCDDTYQTPWQRLKQWEHRIDCEEFWRTSPNAQKSQPVDGAKGLVAIRLNTGWTARGSITPRSKTPLGTSAAAVPAASCRTMPSTPAVLSAAPGASPRTPRTAARLTTGRPCSRPASGMGSAVGSAASWGLGSLRAPPSACGTSSYCSVPSTILRGEIE